jgi:prophage regulatory protein
MIRKTIGRKITDKEPVLLRLHDVLKALGISRSTWLAGIQKGFYPEPLRISKGCVVWRAEDIKKLIIDEPVLSVPEVLELLPISRSTWFAGVKEGRYPQPVVVPGHGKKWRLSDIKKLIELLPVSNIRSRKLVSKLKADNG